MIPPVVKCLIGGSQHGTGVVVKVAATRVGIHILVPPRVKGQRGIDQIPVRVGIQFAPRRAAIATGIACCREVFQRVHRVGVVIQAVILARGSLIVVRSTEAVEQRGEARHVAVRVDDGIHVVGCRGQSVHFLNVAILAGDVTLDELLAVHPGIGHRRRHAVGEDVQVVVGDVVQLHIGRQEVNHRLRRVVAKQHDALLAILVLCPEFRVRHLVGVHARNAVEHRCSRFAAHALSFFRRIATDITEQFHQIGIVHHCAVEQQFFLSQRQVFILTHAPIIRLEERIIHRIVGNKQRFATRLAQYRCLVQVVDEAQCVSIVAILLQPLVNGVAEPGRLTCELILVAGLEKSGKHEQQHGTPCHHPTCFSHRFVLLHCFTCFF